MSPEATTLGGATVGDACGIEREGCITCGDVAVPLTVVRLDRSGDAVCHDGSGATEVVAVDLVGPVDPGDRLLVHAAVAIARLDGPRAGEEAIER